MAYTTINKSTDYFNTKLYTGNGGTQSITGVGFQPDWTWIKPRSIADNHVAFDAVRGATKVLKVNLTNAESTVAQTLTSFNSDGFSIGSDGEVSGNNATYASWNWKAGTSFTNDASGTGIGSIDSAGSVNDTAGFSIVSWTGTGSAGTIKHGLSTVPKMIIIKNRTDAINWIVYHNKIGNTGAVFLDVTNGTDSGAAYFNNTSPTNSVFSVGNYNGSNGSNDNMIAYCFAEKQGYSKMKSYVGNGNVDGNFIYLGFKPALIILKGASGSGSNENWSMYDNKRLGYNVDNNVLAPNASAAELTDDNIDLLSNGFKIRRATGLLNDTAVTYIYYAVAENPFVTSSGVPTTAR